MAAGQGVRMGGPVPKQFMELDGLPVLQRTIERFLEALPSIEVVTVLPANCFDLWDALCGKHNFNCPQKLVKGGLTRFHSVKNALEVVPDDALVFIHDGVRPFVSVELLRRMERVAQECHALIPVLPVTDTVKSLEKDKEGVLHFTSSPDPDRSFMYGAQTPQIFRSEEIREAYRQAYDQTFTDDASVARRSGIPIDFIEGEKYNIKLTTPEDFAIARLYLKM